MSLATYSKGFNVLSVLLGLCAVALMSFVYIDTASARPHGITGGYVKCHGKRKHNGRCHQKKHPKHHPGCRHHKKGRKHRCRIIVGPPKCRSIQYGEKHVVGRCLPGKIPPCEDCGLPPCSMTVSATCEESLIKCVDSVSRRCDEAHCLVGYASGKPNPGCKPVVCYGCKTEPCEFTHKGCSPQGEEAFEVKNLEVYQIEGEKVTPGTWGSADIYQPVDHQVTVRFVARYGDFGPVYNGGSKYESSLTHYSQYEPPCKQDMPADGFDEAWVEVYDLTADQSIESEHIKFNIQNPENVHIVHPVG